MTKAAAAAYTITDHDYIAVEGKVHNCMWNQKPYTAKHVEVCFGEDAGPSGDRVPPTPLVFVRWTDPDGIIHTVERPLPGGGMGPFYIQVT